MSIRSQEARTDGAAHQNTDNMAAAPWIDTATPIQSEQKNEKRSSEQDETEPVEAFDELNSCCSTMQHLESRRILNVVLASVDGCIFLRVLNKNLR